MAPGDASRKPPQAKGSQTGPQRTGRVARLEVDRPLSYHSPARGTIRETIAGAELSDPRQVSDRHAEGKEPMGHTAATDRAMDGWQHEPRAQRVSTAGGPHIRLAAAHVYKRLDLARGLIAPQARGNACLQSIWQKQLHIGAPGCFTGHGSPLVAEPSAGVRFRPNGGEHQTCGNQAVLP